MVVKCDEAKRDIGPVMKRGVSLEALKRKPRGLQDPPWCTLQLKRLLPVGALRLKEASCVICVTELRLPRLCLQGPLSPQLGLRKLSLRSNLLNGTIPPSIGRCSILRAIFLQSNAFSGMLPPEIFNLTELQILNVAQNILTGRISSGGLSASLRFLDLSSNSLSEEILANVFACVLHLLNLSFNRLIEEIPPSFGESATLEYLWLDENLLQGSISVALANCSLLRHLSVRDNDLSGEISTGIGWLPNLQVLTLSHNNLSSVLPSSIFFNASGSSPPLLRILHFGFNKLTSIAPPENNAVGGVASSLQVLDLQSNIIDGEVSFWLVNMMCTP